MKMARVGLQDKPWILIFVQEMWSFQIIDSFGCIFGVSIIWDPARPPVQPNSGRGTPGGSALAGGRAGPHRGLLFFVVFWPLGRGLQQFSGVCWGGHAITAAAVADVYFGHLFTHLGLLS